MSATLTAAMTPIETPTFMATATVRANSTPHPTVADLSSESVSK